MSKNTIIDEFSKDVFCRKCGEITEHYFERLAINGDINCIEDYAQCDVCGYTDEYYDEDEELTSEQY